MVGTVRYIMATPDFSPFAAGSISLRLYPHNELAATAIVDELRAQARLGADRGFDGVMTSEHHGGFAGYLPNPLQIAGWLLEAMPSGWAAPCPLLLPLRPPALVAEEVAWLAARFPGRVGIGVAAGALQDDFDVMGVPMDDLAGRFARGLEQLTSALSGHAEGVLAGDRALQRCAEHSVPVVSAAMGFTAVRRAARVGAGLLFDSLTTPARCGTLVEAFRDAGGTGPCILIRRAWLGAAPRKEVEQQLDVYRSYSAASAQSHWEGNQLASGADPDAVAQHLASAAREAHADALNLRVHVPGVSPEAAREQITALGETVLPRLRELVQNRAV
jgi:alkanesulfonate monooxygenase SsuD/methylene tetrahydromethanopterin reductase-like flavin-dependent oxidoreductase (luciferase family)